MTRTQENLLTIEDLYRLPDDGLHYELSRGLLVSEPPQGGRHGQVVAKLTLALTAFAERHKLGVVFAGDTGFVLARKPATVRAPDVAFIVARRYATLGDITRAIQGPPDLAVEVLSPGDRPGPDSIKVSDYIAAGTREVWLIDPRNETVHIHKPANEPALLAAADTLTAEDLLPGFRVRVGELFRTIL